MQDYDPVPTAAEPAPYRFTDQERRETGILIVDSVAGTRGSLKQILFSLGYTIVFDAQDETAALGTLEEQLITHLILLIQILSELWFF